MSRHNKEFIVDSDDAQDEDTFSSDNLSSREPSIASGRQDNRPRTRRRNLGSSSRISKTSKVKGGRKDTSFVKRVLKDVWNLLMGFLGLYPVWKWILLVYLAWLGITYTLAGVYRFAISNLRPICAIPIIGPRISLCEIVIAADRQINVTRVIDSQDALTVVMGE
jgi:hypothetical protein